MRNNTKGFTLIELLAVIIILAIIALIAVPTILNIINDARRESNINSAYGVVAAAETYYAEQMLNPEEGKAKGEVSLPIEFVKENPSPTQKLLSDLPVKGKKPVAGTVIICSGNEIDGRCQAESAKAGTIVIFNLAFDDTEGAPVYNAYDGKIFEGTLSE